MPETINGSRVESTGTFPPAALAQSFRGSSMDRFIARQNIEHFCQRLQTEENPEARASLHHLLIAEEDKLGFDLEQLATIEREITEANKRMPVGRRWLRSSSREGIAMPSMPASCCR